MASGSAKFMRFGAASIKSKMTAFAFVATLVPTLTIGWLYYDNHRDLLEESVSQRLTNTAENLSGELGRWVLERQHEQRVFAASYVVAENLPSALVGDDAAAQRIGDYLHSVATMVPDLDALAVADPHGRVVATSHPDGDWAIPDQWFERLASGSQALGQPYFDAGHERFLLPLGTQLTDLEQRAAGILIARLHLERVSGVLRAAGQAAESAYLIDATGRVAAVGRVPPVSLNDQLSSKLMQRLQPARIASFWHDDGVETVGTIAPVGGTDWSIIVEQPSELAFAIINELERLILGLGLLFVIGMSLIAYVFAHGLAAPLKRLTEGAAKVADGDLGVELPVQGRDEIAYLTRVFGKMVKRLNAGRAALDRSNSRLRARNQTLKVLSSTDPLTGLYNRQHLNSRLGDLLEVSRERGESFALLMMDLDHFKRLNDRHGHLAGDEALKLIADELRAILRDDDYAARFGGEEFLVLLPLVDEKTAILVAERLRSGIEKHPIDLRGNRVRLTLSIGVAVFPEAGTDADALIQAADHALYQAKSAGRNRTVSFSEKEIPALFEPKKESAG